MENCFFAVPNIAFNFQEAEGSEKNLYKSTKKIS